MRWQNLAFAAILCPCFTGCLAAPKSLSALKSKSGSDDGVKRAGYWDESGSAEPDALLSKGHRVVITAFDVELVDLQFQPAMKKQLLIKPPPIPIGPLGFAAAGVELIGLGRRNTRIPEEDQRKLTAELYAAFVADLQNRGLEVVSKEETIASPGFVKLSKRTVVNSSPLMLLNPLGSDTGQVMHTRTISAPGLGVRRAWSLTRDSAEARILKDTHADMALDVCLRVGTYQKKAALEHRSTIQITTAKGKTTLKANQSILSDAEVTDGNSRFIPVAGRTVLVRGEDLSRELQAMLPEFLSMALTPAKR